MLEEKTRKFIVVQEPIPMSIVEKVLYYFINEAEYDFTSSE